MKSMRHSLAAMICFGAVLWSGIRIYEHWKSLEVSDFQAGGLGTLSSSSDPSVFAPFQVVPPFPAITDPPIVSAAAISGEVTANEMVLGVALNGEARAYPINMLTGPDREIINDHLGGVAIAATW